MKDSIFWVVWSCSRQKCMKKSEPNTFLCCFSHFCYIIQVPVCKIWSALFPSQSSLSINNSNLIATLVLVHWKMHAYIRKCVISTKDMVIKVQLSKVDILSVCACELRLRLANFNFRPGRPARQDVMRRRNRPTGFLAEDRSDRPNGIICANVQSAG